MLSVECIESESRFLDLRAPWNRLAQSLPRRSVFLFHQWFEAAWQWRKSDSTLFILCAYADHELVGVLPLVRSVERGGVLGPRKLGLLTVPDTQLCDLLSAQKDAAAVASAFAGELIQRQGRWDEIRLDYLQQDGAAMTVLHQAFASKGFRTVTTDQGRNLSIALDSSWEDYYGARSRSLKKANNLAANRLKKRGEPKVEWLEPGCSDGLAIEAALDTSIDVSRRSWKRGTGTSLDQPGPGAFIRRLSELGSAAGWLSIWTLKLDDAPLATEYQLIYEDQVHALRADFDADCIDISPGSYLSHCLLQRLFERRFSRYLMGPGENAYKLRWSSDGERLHHVTVFGRSMRGRASWLLETAIKPAGRRLLRRLRRSADDQAESSSAKSPDSES